MEIYLIMFASCFICCYLSSRMKGKKASIFFDILSIMIPAIIAGCRDLSIGTDISVYGEYMHNVASHSNISNFFSIFGYQDILYSILTIVVGGVFKDIHIFLFILQLLNCAIIYKACKNQEDRVPVCVSYLLFLLTLYFRQLNLLRQGLSLSFSILAISYLLKDKKKQFLIFSLFAVLSHVTALILLLAYMIYINTKKDNNGSKRNNKYFLPAVYATLVGIQLLLLPFLKLIASTGLLPSKYTFEYFTHYLNVGNWLDNLGTFFKLFWCLVIWGIATNDKIKSKIYRFNYLFHFVFIDFILWNFNITIHYADRLSFYFGYAYMMFLLPQVASCFRKGNGSRLFYDIVLIVAFAFYWFVRFVIQNAGAVYPYVHY